MYSIQFSSVTQSCLALCDPMDCSTPGLPVHHQLPEFTQTHVRWVSDAIQLSEYYLCEKHYKPITAQYYITDCVSWVLKLTLLDLWTNWTYKCALRMELIHMQGTYCHGLMPSLPLDCELMSAFYEYFFLIVSASFCKDLIHSNIWKWIHKIKAQSSWKIWSAPGISENVNANRKKKKRLQATWAFLSHLIIFICDWQAAWPEVSLNNIISSSSQRFLSQKLSFVTRLTKIRSPLPKGHFKEMLDSSSVKIHSFSPLSGSLLWLLKTIP